MEISCEVEARVVCTVSSDQSGLHTKIMSQKKKKFLKSIFTTLPNIQGKGRDTKLYLCKYIQYYLSFF